MQIAFFNGAALDPVPPKAGKRRGRYYEILEDDELDEEQLRSWSVRAAALPGERV